MRHNPALSSCFASAVPLRQILASRAQWGLLLARVVSDPVWYFYQFWLPGYF